MLGAQLVEQADRMLTAVAGEVAVVAATMFADRGPHRLLIPSKDREAREAELAALERFGVSVDTFESDFDTFESDRGYQAVDQAALLIAPAETADIARRHSMEIVGPVPGSYVKGRGGSRRDEHACVTSTAFL